MKKLSSDNPNDCTQICFNYSELHLICRFLESGIKGLNMNYDENITLKVEAETILSVLEGFRDQFE